MRLSLLIFLYVAGYLVFTRFADFSSVDEGGSPTKISLIWSDVYYIWQPLVFSMSWWCLMGFAKGVDRKRVKWVFLFSLLMLSWDIIRVSFGVENDDHWAVMLAFLSIVGVISCLVLMPESKAAKFLDKHLLKQDDVQ